MSRGRCSALWPSVSWGIHGVCFSSASPCQEQVWGLLPLPPRGLCAGEHRVQAQPAEKEAETQGRLLGPGDPDGPDGLGMQVC